MMESSDRILAFVAGGVPLFTPITGVERVIEELDVMQIPFAAPGLVGLLDLEREFLPLYDLEALAGDRPPLPRQSEFALVAVLPTPVGRLALRLDRLTGLFPSGEPVPGDDSATDALPEPIRRSIGGAMRLQGLLSYFFAPDLFAEVVMQGAPRRPSGSRDLSCL